MSDKDPLILGLECLHMETNPKLSFFQISEKNMLFRNATSKYINLPFLL